MSCMWDWKFKIQNSKLKEHNKHIIRLITLYTLQPHAFPWTMSSQPKLPQDQKPKVHRVETRMTLLPPTSKQKGKLVIYSHLDSKEKEKGSLVFTMEHAAYEKSETP